MTSKGKLYLIPSMLSNVDISKSLPSYNVEVVNLIRHFVVEESTSAYRILRQIGFTGKFDDVVINILNEHTSLNDISEYLNCVEDGLDVGLLSEAGLPCIADPGAALVKIAHQRNIRIVPLIGPNSIVLALISSGMNGQNFTFHGYPPIKSPQREHTLKMWEKQSAELNQTQIFIETPYRNLQLLGALTKCLKPDTLLSISANLQCPDEFISTKTIYEWMKNPQPDIHKKPAVFCIFAAH